MMQEQANDPTRLWQNRGGQLLKEEKERKVIQKVIIFCLLLFILCIKIWWYENINFPYTKATVLLHTFFNLPLPMVKN